MRKFLQTDRLGVIGLVVGILGIATSIATYTASQHYSELVFTPDFVRAEIISTRRVSASPLRIFRDTGAPVKSDVTAIQFYIWNSGTDIIRSSQVLEPLTLRFDSPTAIILDYKIVRASRAVCKFTITPGAHPNELNLHFALLEPADGFNGQIIVEGPSDAKVSIGGTIESTAVRSAPSLRWWSYVWLFVLVTGPFTMLIIVLNVARKEIQDPEVRTARTRQAIVLIVAVLGIVMAYEIGFIVALRRSSHPDEIIGPLIRESIPVSIRPTH